VSECSCDVVVYTAQLGSICVLSRSLINEQLVRDSNSRTVMSSWVVRNVVANLPAIN